MKTLKIFLFILIFAYMFAVNTFSNNNDFRLDDEISVVYGIYWDENVYIINNKGKVIFACDANEFINIEYNVVVNNNKRYLLMHYNDGFMSQYRVIDINEGKEVEIFDETSSKLENYKKIDDVEKEIENIDKTEYVFDDYKLYKKNDVWWAKSNETIYGDVCIGKDFVSVKDYKANGKTIHIFTYEDGETRIKKQDFSNDIVLSNGSIILNYDLLEKGYIVIGNIKGTMGETYDFDFNKVSNFGDDGKYHKCHIPCYELLTLNKFDKRYYYARANGGFVPGNDVLYDENLDEIKFFYKEKLILPYATDSFVTISEENDKKEFVLYDKNFDEINRIENIKYSEIGDIFTYFYDNEEKQRKANMLLCRLKNEINESTVNTFDILNNKLEIIHADIIDIGRAYSNYFQYYEESKEGHLIFGYMDFEGNKLITIDASKISKTKFYDYG